MGQPISPAARIAWRAADCTAPNCRVGLTSRALLWCDVSGAVTKSLQPPIDSVRAESAREFSRKLGTLFPTIMAWPPRELTSASR